MLRSPIYGHVLSRMCWIVCHNRYPQYGYRSVWPFLQTIFTWPVLSPAKRNSKKTLEYFGMVLDELKRLGFVLYPSESCMIVRGAGHRFLHWKRHNFTLSTNHQTRCLKLATHDGPIYIPMQNKCLYLGTFMSYDSFEMQTIKLQLRDGNSLKTSLAMAL